MLYAATGRPTAARRRLKPWTPRSGPDGLLENSMLQRIAYGASVIIILLGLIAADAVLALTASPTANPLAALLARGSVVPLTALIPRRTTTSGTIRSCWRRNR